MSYKFLFPFMLCFLLSPVFSQEEESHDNNLHDNQDSARMMEENFPQQEELVQVPSAKPAELASEKSQQEISVNEDSVFIINSFTFNIEGYTRPYALINHGKLITGEKITGLKNVEKYILDKTQLLINQRVLDSASVDYIIGMQKEDGMFPLELIINTKDTWNIVAIPRPKYSSNSGFDITLKARDYNFLGTMSPLRLDLGYMYNENGEHFFLFLLDSDIPLRILNLNWNFNFDNFFDYRPNMEQPYFYKNVTGLSVELPVKFTTVTVGFNESFIMNEENSDKDKPDNGNFQDVFYMSSMPFLSWEIPTGLEIGAWGELIYIAGISAVFNHEFSNWPLDKIRKGPFLDFYHSIGFNRIDWIGNFLKGFDVSVYNSFSYNFYNSANNLQPWGSFINVTGIGHFVFDDFFGISARLVYRHWFFTETGSGGAGDVMRGILDKDVTAEFMISANFDLPIRAIRFKPSVFFNNEKYRIFNFDLHIIPILDLAIYRNPENETLYKGTDFTYKNILVSSGLEVIIFPDFFRSLFLRISLGFNLSSFISNSKYELFIGTDFHY